jgi:hypothetical protein
LATDDIWKNDYDASEKYKSFLEPHSRHHESFISPLFLFELKSIEALSLFKQVQVRDGLLSAFLFFKRYPAPLEEMETELYLDITLYPIIPEKWLKSCSFYHTVSYKNLEHYNQKLPVYIIANENNDHIHYPDFKTQLESIYTYFDKKDIFPQIKFVGINKHHQVSTSMAGASDRYFKIIKHLLTVYPDAEICNWEKLNQDSLLDSVFYNIKSSSFHVNDDYINWKFLTKGAIPYGLECLDRDDPLSIPQSPYHGLKLLNLDDLRKFQNKRNNIQDYIRNNIDNLADYSEQNFATRNDDGLFLAPEQYYDFIRKLVTIF